MTTYWP